ncbi:MAG: VWA domain-containing protein [Anaerolineales bacterium]|nr:VWA domain-containing protein [Anaerolineales bacterium]
MEGLWKRIRFFAVPIALAAFCAPGGAARAQDSEPLEVHITQVDASAFPTVRIYLSVTDSAGEPAPVDLERIRLYENGTLIQPDSVEAIGESAPLTTMLVMDISGSMNYAGKMESAKAAAIAYVNQMRKGDEAGLISFDTEITYVQPTTKDREALKAAIESLRTGSDTAMYDAVYEGIELLQAISGRKAIIVLTDGMDNRSKHSAEEVLARIGPEGLSISTIGLGDTSEQAGGYAGIDETALQYLARQAGGTYGFASDPDSLRRLYELYGRALQSEYVITYTSPAALRDGLNRSLSVQLAEDIPSLPGESQFNPGGLVPEVPASPSYNWSLFLSLLAALMAMLLAPMGIQWAAARIHSAGKPAKAASSAKAAAPKIKLSEAKKTPRVKLK